MDLDGEAGAPLAEEAPLEEVLTPGADCILQRLQRLRIPNEPQGDRCSASSSGEGGVWTMKALTTWSSWGPWGRTRGTTLAKRSGMIPPNDSLGALTV